MDGLSVYLITVLIFYWLADEPKKVSPPLATPVVAQIRETAILLPESDGKKSAIVIKSMGQEVAVTEPFQGIEIKGGKLENKVFSAEEVQRLYPDVMQALPQKPRLFTLQFLANGTHLTAESMALLAEIQQEIGRRDVPEITVVGHTDREGSDEANLRLSLSRAEKVRDILVSKGVPAQIIQVIGRGELEPVVETPDGVAEARNRRVEISVR